MGTRRAQAELALVRQRGPVPWIISSWPVGSNWGVYPPEGPEAGWSDRNALPHHVERVGKEEEEEQEKEEEEESQHSSESTHGVQHGPDTGYFVGPEQVGFAKSCEDSEEWLSATDFFAKELEGVRECMANGKS